MDLTEYQKLATKTDQAGMGKDIKGLSIAALGLVSEAGSLANLVKKYLRDGIEWQSQRNFVTEELGDVLWYLANIATRLSIDLSEVAQKNLDRTLDRFGEKGKDEP